MHSSYGNVREKEKVGEEESSQKLSAIMSQAWVKLATSIYPIS